jgi:hypothetical protein
MSTDEDCRKMSEKLGEWQIVQKDLIPILIQHCENEDLTLCVGNTCTHQIKSMNLKDIKVEIIVALTWPLEPKDPTYANQQDVYQEYKEALSHEEVLEAVMKVLVKHIEIATTG